MSASGTAAILKTADSEQAISNLINQTNSLNISNQPQSEKKDLVNDNEQHLGNKSLKIDINSARNFTHWDEKGSNQNSCHLCHIPYSETSVPFPATLVKCAICKKAKVPDVLFMTIEPPLTIPISGHGTIIQARVCRSKRETKGEQCAKEISDVIINYFN